MVRLEDNGGSKRIVIIPANAGIQNGRSGNASRILDTGPGFRHSGVTFVRRYDESGAHGMPWEGLWPRQRG